MNGILITVQPHLIRRMKHHFVTFDGPVKLIIGTNGYIWIYYSPVTLTEETLVGREAQGEHQTINEVRVRIVARLIGRRSRWRRGSRSPGCGAPSRPLRLRAGRYTSTR